MTKRGWLKAFAATVLSLFSSRSNIDAHAGQTPQMVAAPGPAEKLLPQKFPFDYVVVNGAQAFAEWEKLKTAGRGIPVIVGGDDDLQANVDIFNYYSNITTDDILKKADALEMPFDMEAFRRKEFESLKALLKAQGNEINFEDLRPEMGQWPTQPEVISGPTVQVDVLSRKPLGRVYIVLVPAKSSADIPAFLHWGGWNACPPPEVHVALLRKWHAKYGAELVSMSRDVVDLRVTQRPNLKEEAVVLASEQYQYCGDLVGQDSQGIKQLAGALLVSDWWCFWWD